MYKKRTSSPLTVVVVDDELPIVNIDYITGIVEKYFSLHSQIAFVLNEYQNLQHVYSDIYATLLTENRLIFDNSIGLNSIDLNSIDLMKPLQKSENRKFSYHNPVLPDLKDVFQIGPVDVFLTTDNKFILKKFKLFKKNDDVDIIYTQQLMLVIREIVMQLYGYYLNSIRPLHESELEKNLVIIPKIYFVQRHGDFIFVCMENIPHSQNEEYLTYEKWNPIINSVFRWFESHKLYHHDTAHRNVFLSSSEKLAVIDFGEAYVEYDNMNSENKSQAQPNGYFKVQDSNTFTHWIEGRNENPKEHEIYGGIKRKNSIKKKTKKRRGKKGKKINTRRKK
jgi:hypothetical protein